MNSFIRTLIGAALMTVVSTPAKQTFAQTVDDVVVAQARADLVSALTAAVSDARRFTVEGVSLGMTVAELEDAMGLASGTLEAQTRFRTETPAGVEFTLELAVGPSDARIVTALTALLPQTSQPPAAQMDALVARFGDPDFSAPGKARYGDNGGGPLADAFVDVCNARAGGMLTKRDVLQGNSVRQTRKHLAFIAQHCPDTGDAYRDFIVYQVGAKGSLEVGGSERTGGQRVRVSLDLPAAAVIGNLAKF